MRFKKMKDTYFVRLDRGEKIIDSVKDFCTKNNIKCGYFSGIGALDEVELAHYIVENKKYTSKVFKQVLEITNLTGNITTMDNEVYLHCHITLGDDEMKAISGHLKEGKIAATCEIILVKLDAEINRKHDELIGLNLLDI
ncbi:MAG: DNA-binding protein [Nanoarchaeota archaeon]|nr:DNA-binding protein [Nanoarchaeota archaeon]